MINRQTWHNYAIAVQAFVVVLVLLKLVIHPTKENRSVTSINFPESVPLGKWQQLESKSLEDKLIPKSGYFVGENVGGHSYKYSLSGGSLTIEMRYLVNTNGDLKYFVKDYTGSIETYLYEKPGIGSYSMYSRRDRVYLTTCINPYGETSVTSDRFRRNGLRHAINPKRILIWLTSQDTIVDNRCLWAYLSMPLQDSPPETVYPLLEDAWFNWHQWWTENYPKLGSAKDVMKHYSNARNTK